MTKSTSSVSTAQVFDGQKHLGLNERLGLIGLIEEGMRLKSSKAPVMADLFDNLWGLVDKTVSGSKIDRLKPDHPQNGFSVFEINAETGENLGRLNMLYLKKPIPCYYLVYVEVAPPFRKKGLGNRILEHFRDFLIKKSAVGILDNIIPKEDPTYDIYFKQAWEPVEAIIGDNILNAWDNYMIYVPPTFQGRDLREPITKLMYHLKRKRAAIDMRDNELMVRRTIDEFKDLYAALLTYFEKEISRAEPTLLTQFMFTRFVTKLVAFRRRIGDLLGYTGGESMEQIVLTPEIAALPVTSYTPQELASETSFVYGDRELWLRLPEDLKKRPSAIIESLPNYRRPNLMAWLYKRDLGPNHKLTLGDIMDIGFDPTRLKEISIDGEAFIFERVQARQLPELDKRRGLLERMASEMACARARNALLMANPSLLVIQDRGNAYILRRKIDGIHWEEAVEQLQTSPHLKAINTSIRIDRVIYATVRKAKEITAEQFGYGDKTLSDSMACFVSWDLKANKPTLMIDSEGVFLESVWMA
jgi:hypothetical protein